MLYVEPRINIIRCGVFKFPKRRGGTAMSMFHAVLDNNGKQTQPWLSNMSLLEKSTNFVTKVGRREGGESVYIQPETRTKASRAEEERRGHTM
jgi:hypothetical protein